MVQCVAGDRAQVKTLIGPDSDPHLFEPNASDARAMKKAQLVVVNGMAFEPWLSRLRKSVGAGSPLVVATDGIKLRISRDPHAWLHPANAAAYYEDIRSGLAAVDPAHASSYEKNAAECARKLDDLDAEIRAGLASIPKEKRRVIVGHSSFAYFSAAYDVQFLSPVGASTEMQPSAKRVADLITQIRREKITAVFVENISDPRLIEQIARETGVKLGGKLYADALSKKDGPAPTYLALMRHNAKLLTAAMSAGF
ncbi:MAG: zinc ABC transporter substrate-binding protein [Alphaproteobacteria bacterium]|nr:zinc ABC transporter substrate-binding protein [Alphaproteobacteria bacterium]